MTIAFAFLGGIVTLLLVQFTIFAYAHRNGWSEDAEPLPLADPWQLQHKLMQISGQSLPVTPTLNRDALLYWCLIVEEMAELTEALTDAWQSTFDVNNISDVRHGSFWLMRSTGDIMTARSSQIRKGLERVPRMSVQLPRVLARPMLDGITDLMVVASGFSLSAGMPGSQAYLSVQMSNLSKANPETGKIDKDPSGKWIKGSNFKLPDLDSLLP